MKLRISLNVNKLDGSYGGGNQFANNLEAYLSGLGHEVYRTLVPDLDIILIVSSKYHHRTTSYDLPLIQEYVMLNHNTSVIHRVNSSDQSHGQDSGINANIVSANRIADHTIFISNFIKELFREEGIDLNRPHHVILNGADSDVFHPQDRANWQPGEKLKIVTHHWSNNFMKGFDIYERLDQLLDVSPYQDLFEFTCIGNIPLGINFRNTSVIPPVHGTELANLLRQNHVYVTAARNEAAGMHHVEGMRCGLPVLFLNSGALSEYCGPYGIEFNLTNLEEKLKEMAKSYSRFRNKVLECPYSDEWMASQYLKVFEEVVERRRRMPFPPVSIKKKMKVYFYVRLMRKIQALKNVVSKARQFLNSKSGS